MQEVNDELLLLEALSDKVLHQLPPAVWKGLFLGAGRDSIHFEQRHLTLVHADAVVAPGGSTRAWEEFCRALPRLAEQHGGRLDPYGNATALVTFGDPAAAVRMGLALLKAAGPLGLRVGVVSGPCTLAFFRAHDRLWCTPLGLQTQRAAALAAKAPAGDIMISPETYAPPDRSALAPETADFEDSERDLSTLAAALQAQGGETAHR